MRYAKITNLDIANGVGIGVALFVQGCPHRCGACFNKETWDFNKGREWTKAEEDMLFGLVEKPFISRLTLLGGEPLAEQNLDSVLSIIQRMRNQFPQKKIWLYTGYEFENILSHKKRFEIIKMCDVIVDGRFIEELKDITYPWAGSTNQRVIDVQKTLKTKNFHIERWRDNEAL